MNHKDPCKRPDESWPPFLGRRLRALEDARLIEMEEG